MSVLPEEVHTALTQLLQGLQSTDNTARTAAEEQLNKEWVAQRPDYLLMGLAEQMGGSSDEGTRSFAAVLFRRIATRAAKDDASGTSKEVFLRLPHETKVTIRAKLLQSYANETNKCANLKPS